MRNISFFLTTQQFIDETKDITRRQGWWNVMSGTILMGVKKGQGLKKGEKVEKLHPIEILDHRLEPIEDITPEDVVREGFPDKTTEWFIEMYCKANHCQRTDLCSRMVFRHLKS